MLLWCPIRLGSSGAPLRFQSLRNSIERIMETNRVDPIDHQKMTVRAFVGSSLDLEFRSTATCHDTSARECLWTEKFKFVPSAFFFFEVPCALKEIEFKGNLLSK